MLLKFDVECKIFFDFELRYILVRSIFRKIVMLWVIDKFLVLLGIKNKIIKYID